MHTAGNELGLIVIKRTDDSAIPAAADQLK
jgi:hypothetical protein